MLDTDTEYEETIVAKASLKDGYWNITREDGWSFGWKDTGVEPRVGDTLRFYGRGLGSIVRGVLVNGEVIFYLSPEEQEQENKRKQAEAQHNKHIEFEKNKASLDVNYAALPPSFQRRIDRFRTGNPNFRWEYEAYEMRCCVDAIKIAETLGNESEVERFNKLDWDEQKKLVPGLDDAHSGNSFGVAVGLAKSYLHDPNLPSVMHGALVVLVGCEEYGCTHPSQ